MPAIIPYKLPEISTTDYPDATDLNTAINLINQLKGYVLENEINIREQLNLVIESIESIDRRIEK